ncbi:MAG TPA: type II toxin-antitoxin system VapC family toxin [Pseudonocardiaceae bacterium]|nr:type II toxin-antitoxin system VapC family toxin [Pseudonocardiaceae bacterium]
MRLLLDTHALIWWLEGGTRLREEARAAIRSRANEVRVSSASAVEISIKVAKGKLDAPGDLVTQMVNHGFMALPLTIEHGIAMLGFPANHGDPFDRLLIAQARCEGLTIVTRDSAFAAYDVPILPA